MFGGNAEQAIRSLTIKVERASRECGAGLMDPHTNACRERKLLAGDV
jgi:hypothetical protein